jgi:hypothetical protein
MADIVDQNEAKELIRNQMTDRVDLSSTINAIKEGTYSPVVPRSDLDTKFNVWVSSGGFDMNEEEREKALEVWDKLKIERNACIAIFVDEAWQSFHDQRTGFNYGSQRHWDINVANNLMNDTQQLFDTALNEWKKARDGRLEKPKSEWDALDVAYDRYRAIIDFGDRNTMTREDDASTFIQRGVATAANTIWSLIELVPQLSEKKNLNLDGEQIMETIKKGYGPIILQFASMNKKISVPLLNALTFDGIGFKPEYFDLIDSGNGGYKLTIDHNQIMQLKDREGNIILRNQPSTETTWCPARYTSANGKDIIKEYFEWCLDLTKKIYLPTLKK